MSTQGWNKCDDCGKFAKPEELMFDELRSLDLHGNLREEYPQYHKDGYGCAAPTAAAVRAFDKEPTGNDPTGPFDLEGKYLGDLLPGFKFVLRNTDTKRGT